MGGTQQQYAFDMLKQKLTEAETLAYFDKNAKTQIIAEASPVGLGAVLTQVQNGQSRAIRKNQQMTKNWYIKTGEWVWIREQIYKTIQDALCFGKISIKRNQNNNATEIEETSNYAGAWWPSRDHKEKKKKITIKCMVARQSICRRSHYCQLVGQPARPEPMECTEHLKAPWQDFAINIVGPLPIGDHLLVTVDILKFVFFKQQLSKSLNVWIKRSLCTAYQI